MKRILIILAALLGALVLYVDLSGDRFRGRIERERNVILGKGTVVQAPATLVKDLAGIPQPVRKYLQYALSGRTDAVSSVRIKQSGSFRLGEKDNWTPITADHLVLAGQPAFLWHARLQPHPYVWTESRDLLHEGIGKTEHRLYSALPFPLQRFNGKPADVSALVRYLTEAPWFPTALLPGKHLSWKSLDATTARATLSDNGYQVSAVFTFNQSGEIVRVTTENRTLYRSGGTRTLPWSASYQRYELHGGIRVPMEMKTEWSINGRNFPYAKLKVDSITFENI